MVPKFKSLLNHLPSSLVLWIHFVCVAVSHTLSECANFCELFLAREYLAREWFGLQQCRIHTKHKFCPHDMNLKSLTERTDYFRAKPTLNINELVRSIHHLPATAIDIWVADFFFLMASQSASRQKAGSAYASGHKYICGWMACQKAVSGHPPWTWYRSPNHRRR